jgi:hypothetical protein
VYNLLLVVVDMDTIEERGNVEISEYVLGCRPGDRSLSRALRISPN